MTDVRRRIAMAQQRHGKMRHIWKSGHLHQRLKMRLYVAAVCSVMTYGAEAWQLDEGTWRALNGANSKMVSGITGRAVHDEVKKDGKTYDLVAAIRAKRLRWLGQILRMKDDRMVLKATKMMYSNRKDGDILMDAPQAGSWSELRAMATADKGKVWQQLVREIKDGIYIQATKGKGGDKSKSKKRKEGGKKRASKTKKKKEDRKVGAASRAASAATRTNDDEEDSSGDDGWAVSKRKTYKKVQPPIRCNDGFCMSVQASRDHYSVPRDDQGPYTHVEVAGPSEWEDLLLPYRDKSGPAICGMRPMMYGRVPARVIRQVISKHAGMAKYSGRLPRMMEVDEDGYTVEVDEDGCQWAAAAVPPSDSDSGGSGAEADDEDDGADSPMGSPTSAAHLL